MIGGATDVRINCASCIIFAVVTALQNCVCDCVRRDEFTSEICRRSIPVAMATNLWGNLRTQMTTICLLRQIRAKFCLPSVRLCGGRITGVQKIACTH